MARDVMVCSTANIAEMLQSRPTVLDPETRRTICLELDLSLRNAAQKAPAAAPTSRRTAVPEVSSRMPGAPSPQPRSASHRRRKKKRSLADWLKGGIGLAIVLSAAFVPSVYQGAMTGLGGLIADMVAPDIEPAPAEVTEKGERKRQQQRSTE